GLGRSEMWKRFVAYCRIAAPVYFIFLLIDRAYNFYRFGSWTGTYLPIFAREMRAQDPTLPPNFPWSTPFYEGVLGALFKPEKSIFLFDPLLILALALAFLLWKRMPVAIRAYAIAVLFLLVAYISFYARYAYWAGDFAWGDRYVSTSVQMVAMLAVPLLVHYRGYIGRWMQAGGVRLISLNSGIQFAFFLFLVSL